MQRRAKRLSASFQAAFGIWPAGIWRSPGRVNLIGEHTDYNGGYALPMAIDRSLFAALAPRHDDTARLASTAAGLLDPVSLDPVERGRASGSWGVYPIGVALALRGDGVEVRGFDLLVDSDLPAGAGLASSAALCVAVGLGLCELAGQSIEPMRLAALARAAENDAAQAPTGLMDQLTLLFGTESHALFIDFEAGSVEPIGFNLTAAGLSLLVIDTGVRHANTDGVYARRRRCCADAAEALGRASLRSLDRAELAVRSSQLSAEQLRRASHVVAENERVLQAAELARAGPLRGTAAQRLGALMTASHASLRDDFEVSCDELDAVVDAALTAGALGARLTGAGLGGCVIALVPEHLASEIAAATTAALGELAGAGHASNRRVAPFVVRPSVAAHRLR